MSKRRRLGSQDTKKAKTEKGFGAPSADDAPSAQQNLLQSSTPSIRVLSIPSLLTFCARVFATNLFTICEDKRLWKILEKQLDSLPEHVLPKLLAVLGARCPARPAEAFIVKHFLKGKSLVLPDDMFSAKNFTLVAIGGSLGATLLELELSGHKNLTDANVATLVENLVALRKLNLRGCSQVGPLTVEAASNNCPNLTAVNFDHTQVTPQSVASLVTNCQSLAVLKLAGVQKWTDATFAKFLSNLPINEEHKFPNLRTLKIRQLSLPASTLNLFQVSCPNLVNINLSFTQVRYLPQDEEYNYTNLEKLLLTSTQISIPDLLRVLPQMTRLKTLGLGALGGGQGDAAEISNTTALTMSNRVLSQMTDILANLTHLETVNLVGNAKLTSKGGAIAEFVKRVGRKCKRLNLAGIPGLQSSDLMGMLSTDAEPKPSPLEILILNSTGVDDDVAPYLSSCASLVQLDLQRTRVTEMGLFPIVDACSKLEKLNLTGCRGVKVKNRRRFFEHWREQSGPSQSTSRDQN